MDCHGTIEKYERYHRYDGLWDDFKTYKVCNDCHALRESIAEIDKYDDIIAFGDLNEMVEYIDDPSYALEYVRIMRKRGSLHPSWERFEAQHLQKNEQ